MCKLKTSYNNYKTTEVIYKFPHFWRQLKSRYLAHLAKMLHISLHFILTYEKWHIHDLLLQQQQLC